MINIMSMKHKMNNIKDKILSESKQFNNAAEYKDICGWITNNVKNKFWSSSKSGGKLGNTTYVLKHKIENNLNKYVTNNMTKLALYELGYELKTTEEYSNDIFREVCPEDFIINNKNFIWRKKTF